MSNQLMNEKKGITDYSKEGFISSCVVCGLSFILVNKQPPSIGKFAIYYTLGLIAYFGFLGLMKSSNRESNWTGQDVSGGFWSAFFAMGVPTILDLVFG